MATSILKKLQDMGLPASCIRGQGYDGASNMSGKNRRVAALIEKSYLLAKYVHCGSHALNLCIIYACKVTGIRNMMDILKELSLYSNSSPKRQAVLVSVRNVQVHHTQHQKLVDLCKTRWVYRHRAIEAFHELYPCVVDALRQISGGSSQRWDGENRTRALGPLTVLLSCDFLMAFVVVRHVFNYLEDTFSTT